MLIKRPSDIKPSEITPESVFHRRREVLKAALAAGLLPAAKCLGSGHRRRAARADAPCRRGTAPEGVPGRRQPGANCSPGSTTWSARPRPSRTSPTYNNYYEFGTGKTDPAKNAHTLRPHPWSVTVEGEADVTGTFALEDLMKGHTLEDRLYRFRCVEAWSMVVPWVGFPLGDLLKQFEPTSRARLCAVLHAERFGADARRALPGAALAVPGRPDHRRGHASADAADRRVVRAGPAEPERGSTASHRAWKYGFKSIKSIVRIRFMERQPETSWNMANAREYGFYST